MGMDGGIFITEIKDIREKWLDIKIDLIDSFEKGLRTAEKHEKSTYESGLEKSNNLPDSVDELSANEIVNLFSYMKYCDCPYLLKDEYVITGRGDNIWISMEILSRALPSIESIETWT
jgi:hypothetical protein